MIEQADAKLRAWAEAACHDIPVTLGPPATNRPARGISLYLLDVSSQQPPRTSTRPPLQLLVRYLVTAWSEDVEDAHRILGDLAFAALEGDGFDLEPEPVPAILWSALGVPPQPSLVLRVPVRRDRPVREFKPVVHAPEIRTSIASELIGVITGTDHRPMPDCEVEIPSFQLSTKTDPRGFFRFALVPGEPPGLDILVRTGNRERAFHIDNSASRNAPIELQIPQQEG